MAVAADEFFGKPTERLTVAASRGRTGRRRPTYLLRSILEADGRHDGDGGHGRVARRRRGARGAAHDAGGDRPAAPVPRDARRRGRGRRDRGVLARLALPAARPRALRRALSSRTSAQEHLDLHGDMEEYFQAKRRLFTGLTPPPAAVNVGDPARSPARGRARRRTPRAARHVRAAARGGGACRTASSSARGARPSPPRGSGSRRRSSGSSTSRTCSRAVAAATLLDVEDEAIAEGVRAVRGVPGRFEAVDEGQDFAVVVDYAHKPDALAAALQASRQLGERPADGRLRRGRRP